MPLKALTRFPNPDSLSAANTRYEDSARKRQLMGTREQAKRWIKQNYPADTSNILRASKYYPASDIWFFTFPESFFAPARMGDLNILLQYKNEPDEFHFLKVPFSFFRENRERFDIRTTGDKFDLHISAKKRNWLSCERSKNISFKNFEQYKI